MDQHATQINVAALAVMPEVPAIMFSGYGGAFTEKEACSAGVSALVSKSEHISVLLTKRAAR